MRTRSGKEKLSIAIIAWALGLAGMAFGVIYPLQLRIENFPEVYRQATERYARLNEQVSSFARVRAEYEDIMRDAGLVHSQFLTRERELEFITALESLAEARGLYRDIQLVTDPATAGGGAYVFSLTVIGSFEETISFISRMENAPYAIDVASVHVAPVKDGQTFSTPAIGDDEPAEPFRAQTGDVVLTLLLRVHADGEAAAEPARPTRIRRMPADTP